MRGFAVPIHRRGEPALIREHTGERVLRHCLVTLELRLVCQTRGLLGLDLAEDGVTEVGMDVRQGKQRSNLRGRVQPGMRAQRGAQFLFGERELAETGQRGCLGHPNLTEQLARFEVSAAVQQQLDRSFVAGERGAVITVLDRAITGLDQLDRIRRLRLELLVDLEVDHVGERLDRDVEHAGQDAQLVEGRVADALLVAAELGVVDLSTLGTGTFLDAAKRVAVAAP